MKKIIVLCLITLTIFSCSKKVTTSSSKTSTVAEKSPTTNETNTSNLAAGQATYIAKCGKCHRLFDANEKTAAKWVGIVDWMAPKAKLDATEKANVLAYLQANAKM